MSVWKRLVATLVGTCAVIGALSACDPYVPNVVGDTLPKAVERLENAGYKELAVVDDHGMSITESHYEDGYKVTEQDAQGSDIPTTQTITLTVTKSEIASLVSTPTETPSETSSEASEGASPDTEPTTEEPEPAPVEPAEEPAEEPAAPAPAPEPAPAPVHFSSCKQAREAGAAPLYRGDPGYNPKLDRDNDGVACE
jgi:hypothetical protein